MSKGIEVKISMMYIKTWQGVNETCSQTTLHNMGAPLGSSK